MQVYRRNIRKNMLYCLVKLYKGFGTAWVKTNAIDERKLITADFEKLRYWDLIESQNGRHRITQLGIDFLYGRAGVEKYRWVYDGKVQVDPNRICINPILFSHDIEPELMSKDYAIENSTTRQTFKERQHKDLFRVGQTA